MRFVDATGKLTNIDDVVNMALIPLMAEENKKFREEIEVKNYTDFAELLKSKLNHPYIQKQGIDFVNFLKAMVDDTKKEMVGEDK